MISIIQVSCFPQSKAQLTEAYHHRVGIRSTNYMISKKKILELRSQSICVSCQQDTIINKENLFVVIKTVTKVHIMYLTPKE